MAAADARIVRCTQFVVNLVDLELPFRWNGGILLAASLCPPTMRIGLLDRHTGRPQKPRSSPTGAFLHLPDDNLVHDRLVEGDAR